MRVVACVDGYVGGKLTEWLCQNHPNAVALYVTTTKNAIFDYCVSENLPVISADGKDIASVIPQPFDVGLLLWWPAIISANAIAMASVGYVNTHPSLLPLHRGKNPNFWALKAGEPFGVSLHFIGSGIDDGDLIAQTPVPYDWTDNGGSIYARGLDAMIDLFKATFPQILDGTYERQPIDVATGSVHFGRQLEPASRINLDDTFTARDLLNLLRARTFSTHPSCTFEEKGVRYEVRVSITRQDPT